MKKTKNILLFGWNFIKHPIQNASIIPSSITAAKAMLDNIDFSTIKTVVELGPGNGVFTNEILKKSSKNTTIILIEIEKTYVDLLNKKFSGKVIVEHGSAYCLNTILKKYNIDRPDLIISGLPFSIPGIKKELLNPIKKHTENGTIFRFFTYLPPIMKHIYIDLPVRKVSFVLKNFPPLWIYGIN
ncbi:MAG: SAM-dependent methyltransferase [Candidatus Taylorbacteria bacterium]|nr:SAM-dependent methyltransferase [Candidatus Taylorbacteria bacterium]